MIFAFNSLMFPPVLGCEDRCGKETGYGVLTYAANDRSVSCSRTLGLAMGSMSLNLVPGAPSSSIAQLGDIAAGLPRRSLASLPRAAAPHRPICSHICRPLYRNRRLHRGS